MFQKNTAGTVVLVTCHNGYQPVQGHSVAFCNSQGHWDPNPPDCGGQFHYYPLTTSFPITVHSASLPQFRAVLCLFMVMSLQTHPRMPLGPLQMSPWTHPPLFLGLLCSSSVLMEGNFQEMQSSLAFKMAAGPDLCLLVLMLWPAQVGSSFASCYNHQCCLNPILLNFLSNHLSIPLDFILSCMLSFLKSITLTFLTQSLSHQEPAYHSSGEIEQLPHILFHRKHRCHGRCGHWRHSTSAGCHSDNCHCHMEACVS